MQFLVASVEHYGNVLWLGEIRMMPACNGRGDVASRDIPHWISPLAPLNFPSLAHIAHMSGEGWSKRPFRLCMRFGQRGRVVLETVGCDVLQFENRTRGPNTAG